MRRACARVSVSVSSAILRPQSAEGENLRAQVRPTRLLLLIAALLARSLALLSTARLRRRKSAPGGQGGAVDVRQVTESVLT